MKKGLFVLMILLSSKVFAQSENYRAFKVDLMGGWAMPAGVGSTTKGGINFSIEPKYNITDNLALSYKYEGAILVSADVQGADGDNLVSLNTSHLVGAEYYFGDRTVRPFVGAGVGFYHPRYIRVDSELNSLDDLNAGRGFKAGFAPRAGLQIGHFRLAAEYNQVKNNSYWGFKMGFTLGGGRIE